MDAKPRIVDPMKSGRQLVPSVVTEIVSKPVTIASTYIPKPKRNHILRNCLKLATRARLVSVCCSNVRSQILSVLPSF